MDRVRLLPMPLPPASSIYSKKSSSSISSSINIGGSSSSSGSSGNSKGKVSFVRRLALGFVILAGLGLLYVPAYRSAQGQYSGLAPLHGWSYNTTRDVCTYIRPDNATTILNPRSICTESPPYLLIVVCSAVPNLNARQAIRSTWGNRTHLDLLYNSTVKLAFLLGQSDNDTLNGYAMDESHLYNDIIQESFRDTYNNLTLKSVMLLKWVTGYCDKVTYLMKTDDDMFVNVPALVKALKSRPKSTGTLTGSLICNARPITDPKNKWYTPKYMYSERTYPNYLSGTGYVMSLDVAQRLYKAALTTPLLHLEDVYITGLCARRAGLRPVNHRGFSYIPRKLETCALLEAITAHKVNATSMHAIWTKLAAAEAAEAEAERNGTISVMQCASKPTATALGAAARQKPTAPGKLGRHIGYILMKSRILSNRCV